MTHVKTNVPSSVNDGTTIKLYLCSSEQQEITYTLQSQGASSSGTLQEEIKHRRMLSFKICKHFSEKIFLL